MEEVLYELLISFLSCFIIWIVWFVIAAIKHSKVHMVFSTETCIGLLLIRVLGPAIGLIISIVYFSVKLIVLKTKSKESNDNDSDNRL